MSNNSGLYGTGTPSQTVPGNDTTSLYGASSGAAVPTANGDLVVRGNLAVLGGHITTTALTATIFNENATNLSIGGAATTLSLGASSGTTTVNNNLTVDGTFTAPSGDFGNITIAVADDNTISTTTNDLKLDSATNQINVLGKLFVQDELTVNDGTLKTNSGNVFLFNDSVATQADAFTSATTVNIGADSGNTTINNNLIVNDNLTVQGTTITTQPATYIQWAENSSRANRLNFKATNGTTTGIRVSPPVATGGVATSSVNTTNDINNTSFVNLSANQAATNPLRIQTGKYTAGVLGPSGTSLAFVDNATTYATVNPAGPTIGTDLATKSYVDSHEANTTYTIDASTTTGGANFNLVGSDATTDTIKFAGADGTTVTRTDANTITISSATPTDPTKLVNGSYEFVLNADGSVTAPGVIKAYDPMSTSPLTLRGGFLEPTNLVLDDSTATLSTTQTLSGSTGTLTATVDSLTWARGAGLGPGVNGTWSFNDDGTTSFPSYKFPYADGSANQVLKTNGSGVLSWYSPSDLNTTYTIDASSTTGGANFNLRGSDSSVDTIKFAGSGATTVTATDANTITISSTDTNTTYTYTASSATGGANLTLTGSDSSTNTVKVSSGTGVTVSDVSSTEISVAIGQDVATTASPTFANVIATKGMYAKGIMDATYTDGIVVDYATGNGRITVGSADGITFYNGGTGARSTLVAIDTSGNLATTGDVDVKGGDITNSTGALTLSTTSNGNITLSPNGTGVVSLGVTQLADMSRELGQLYVSRNATWTPPSNALTSLAGNNGVAIGSSNPGSGNGYSPQVQLVYCSGDTTAGTNASAAIVTRGASGTTASPSAAATNQVLGTWNVDGYATSGWASAIATTGSGGGTSSISPLQIQAYAVSAFTDSAGTVTNAPTGFRVRGFAASTNLSTANRLSFIDHTLSTATYKATTFNIQSGANTTNYAVFAAGGSTIGGVDSPTTFTRVRGASAGSSPSLSLRNSNTVATTPATGDGTSFRMQTAGSNGTSYILADIAATYSTTGDDSIILQVANGDQTTGTLTGVTLINTKVSSTTINAGTPSGTAGSSTVAQVAQFTPTNNTLQADALTLKTYAGVNLTGNKITYNRVYGQWQYDTTVTPAAANTAYVFPIGTADLNNIATVGSTSRVIPGAAGIYNLQFSIQLNNSDNGSDHIAYIWLRKNGVDVSGSMGQVTATKGNATIAGWNYLVSSANTTDYWELAYAVDNTSLTFPFYASTAFGPSTAALITTLTPVGA
jgi:hypothetical protein